jgi:TRAP-type mannitol/chloroaromatic compound transport system permease large subunit
MMAILIVLGFFIDEVSMMMITLPFYMPLVQRMDVDLVWFGVLFLLCMQIGLLSPPFGLLLFAMKGVAPPHITMHQIIQAVMPYMYFGILIMLIVFLWPPLATWLPRLLIN